MKRVLLVGGGLDSYAVAIKLANQGEDFDLMVVNYGQACWERECLASEFLAEMIGRNCVRGNSSRIRLCEDNAKSLLLGQGDEPIVFLRNLELIMVAAQHGYKNIELALLNERSIMFPDANKSFIHKANDLFASAYGIRIGAPFISEDKWDFVRDVDRLRPFLSLAELHTCWSADVGGCGSCAHCLKRVAIMKYAGYAL